MCTIPLNGGKEELWVRWIELRERLGLGQGGRDDLGMVVTLASVVAGLWWQTLGSSTVAGHDKGK